MKYLCFVSGYTYFIMSNKKLPYHTIPYYCILFVIVCMWYVCDVCLLFYYCIYWTSSLLIKKFSFNYLMYADNTTLYFNIENTDSVNMHDNINIHLEKNDVWLKLNKLTVNVSKIKYIIFHKRRDAPQLNLLLNNIKIEQGSNFTFLGINLDTSLS